MVEWFALMNFNNVIVIIVFNLINIININITIITEWNQSRTLSKNALHHPPPWACALALAHHPLEMLLQSHKQQALQRNSKIDFEQQLLGNMSLFLLPQKVSFILFVFLSMTFKTFLKCTTSIKVRNTAYVRFNFNIHTFNDQNPWGRRMLKT